MLLTKEQMYYAESWGLYSRLYPVAPDIEVGDHSVFLEIITLTPEPEAWIGYYTKEGKWIAKPYDVLTDGVSIPDNLHFEEVEINPDDIYFWKPLDPKVVKNIIWDG